MKKLRYAVVGLGHIAQNAVIPSFKNSKRSELTALISGDKKKLAPLARKYRVKNLFSYEQYAEALGSGLFDAVYIALPNHLHAEYAIQAAQAGIHVLCEKPMAVTSEQCRQMIQACDESSVKLMIAYRLHFEEANLRAIDLASGKKLGDARIFQSIHSMAVKERNIRTLPVDKGGGPTYDIGIYDINAARYVFQSEPISVFAQATGPKKQPFQDIEESMSIVLKFPGERIASILYSYGTVDTDTMRVVGTKGDLCLDPAYTYVGPKTIELTDGKGKTQKIKIKPHDQFSPELDYFAECVLKNKPIEPSGIEGLADIKIIEAIYESVKTGKLIALEPVKKAEKPGLKQEIVRPAIREPETVRVQAPSKEEAA